MVAPPTPRSHSPDWAPPHVSPARLSGGALGALCRAKLEASGVDLTTSVVVDNPATLAIARLDADGAASYEFYTDGTADWGWTDETLAPVLEGPFPATGPPVAVHTGTLALALQPSGVGDREPARPGPGTADRFH